MIVASLEQSRFGFILFPNAKSPKVECKLAGKPLDEEIEFDKKQRSFNSEFQRLCFLQPKNFSLVLSIQTQILTCLNLNRLEQARLWRGGQMVG